jgi:hypothetical protein
MRAGKTAIWLDDLEMEVLRGYLAELMENKRLPNYALAILENAYRQTTEEGRQR